MKNVAVLVSTYNGEHYLKEQLDSILNQSYKEIEIFIRDDGSSDRTVEIIEEYTSTHKNINFIDNCVNLGCAESFLSLLDNVNADYYFFCDQDDIWIDKKVEITLSKFSNNNDIPHLVHSDLFVVNESLNIINQSFYDYQKLDPIVGYDKKKLVVQNYIVGCTVCINKELRDLVVKYMNVPGIHGVAMHDWWVALTAIFFGKITYIDSPLVYYRQHDNNVLGAPDNSFRRYMNSFFSGHGIEKVRSFTKKVSIQSDAFLKAYGHLLSNKDIDLLNRAKLFDSSLGVGNMLKLIFIYNISLQGKKRNLALIYTSFRK
ncbi:glycosyltransferase family 2 protein [Vibrio metschnikovii]|uniref:glycosyltransferase family 2 protein n=1 Tax=Vibrio metschnikovii TaxID=28172 RepID=UPI002FC6671D